MTRLKLNWSSIRPFTDPGIRSSDCPNGGTTIAGTMVLSHLAGIKVFATGGLGGVHKGGQDSMDVSADLTELGRTPVAVISSGCKGFLDIQRTLEFLETQGASVATFANGRSGPIDFPAFWSRDSGIKSPMVLQDAAHAARIISKLCLLQCANERLTFRRRANLAWGFVRPTFCQSSPFRALNCAC